MEDSNPYRKAHSQYPELSSAVQQKPINRGKSYMNFLCKALFFAVVIIILPLFPSKAPDFINESVITKFWELLHLLFIGIAVSYGLFSRRNVVESDPERHSRLDNLQSDMSRMFHVSSPYEDGYEEPYGSGEKRVSQSSSYGHCLLGEPRTFWSEGSTVTVIDEQCKPNLSFSENGVTSGYVEENLIQAWNSQCFQGESRVVVAQPNIDVGQWGESRSGVDYKPLGLPVRSLKPRRRQCESPQFVNGSQSGSDSQGSSSSSVTSRNSQLGDLGPQSFEHKFHEAISSPSPIPWRSRSRMREMREQVSPVAHPSHVRHLPPDEAEFESTRTQSWRSTASFSSQSSSISSSPKNSASMGSISSEELNSKMEDAGNEKSSLGSCSSGSPSPTKSMNDEASSSSMQTRGYSYSSLEEKDPSPPKQMNAKVSSSVLHSRRYSHSSLDEKDSSPPKQMSAKVSSSALHSRRYSHGSLDEEEDLPPKPLSAKVSSSALLSRRYSHNSLDEEEDSPPKPLSAKVSSSALRSRRYSHSLEEKDTSPPKPMSAKVSSGALQSRRYNHSSSDEKDPSPPIPMSSKASSSALHSRRYSYSSLDEKDPSPPREMKDKVSSSALRARRYGYSSLDEKDPSSPKAMNHRVSSSMMHSRGYSYSSLDEKDLRGSKVFLKDFGGGRGEEMKSSSFSKSPSSRGKSVRTIRTSRMTGNEKMQGNQIVDQKVEKSCNNAETGYVRKKNEGIDSMGIRSSSQSLDDPIPGNMPEPAFPKSGKKEREQFSGNVSVESKEDLESKAENVQVNSDGDSVAANNSVADSDEVDRKAGEFIAKFREQIRLQKVESMDRSRGLRLANCFR